MESEEKVNEFNVPDGGLEAWLQVIKAHLLIFVTWGIVNSYGVFQSYYKMTLLKDKSMFSIAWIGTVQGFSVILVSLLVGPAYDRGYVRVLIVTGTVLTLMGMFLLSIAKEYYQFFLYQGICIGIGSGFAFIPSLGVVTQYFDKRLSLAMGIATSGGSIGGLIFPIFFQNLIYRIGFAWTIRLYAFIIAVVFVICIVITEVYGVKHRSPSLFDFSSFKEGIFLIFNAAVFFIFMGIYAPYFFITVYADALGASYISVYLVSMLNVASVFGRLLINYIADHKGPLNLFVVSALNLVILAYIWIAIRSVQGIIVFSILYGFFAGATMSLPSAVIAKLSTNLVYIGTQISISVGFSGIGILIGMPLAGVIVSHSNGLFVWAQVFAATTMLMGVLLASVVTGVVFYKKRCVVLGRASVAPGS